MINCWAQHTKHTGIANELFIVKDNTESLIDNFDSCGLSSNQKTQQKAQKQSIYNHKWEIEGESTAILESKAMIHYLCDGTSFQKFLY